VSQISLIASKSKTIVPNITITRAASAGGLIALTAAGHGLETGDIVQVKNVGGVPAATGQWPVTVTSSSVFNLNNSVFGGSYTSGGGAVHLGWASSTLVDNTIVPNPLPDSLTMKVRLESLSVAGTVRFAVFDAYDSGFTSEELLISFNAAGSTSSGSDVLWNYRLYQMPDVRIGNPGDMLCIKTLIGGGPGTAIRFSAWLES
jgi:hypothetical protein